jgi:3-oxoacyl-[acyl-carrier-protein] synthase III
MKSKIKDISVYFPSNKLDNNSLYNEFPNFEPDKIENKIGIRNRYIVSEDETALDLAINASNNVLENFDRNKIDFLILCTQSPEYYLPTTACVLQDKLGLSTSTGAFDFNLGCSGYIYGLALSKSLISSGIAENILLVMSETYSKHINAKDFANRSIFGDGAAATIIEKSDEEHIFEFVLGTDGKGMNNLIIPNGGMRKRYEQNAEIKSDESGNERTENDLYMNGPEIFNFTIKSIPALVKNTLEKNNVKFEDVDYFIFHQANKYILDYLRKKIKIPEEKFYSNMLETGNTVSATIPIALKDCMDNEIIKVGDRVMLCGFGVGYSWGATIIKI